jgi:hypothetical protein
MSRAASGTPQPSALSRIICASGTGPIPLSREHQQSRRPFLEEQDGAIDPPDQCSRRDAVRTDTATEDDDGIGASLTPLRI